MYLVKLSDTAIIHLNKLDKNEPKAYQKALKLIGELHLHPTTGTGKPEHLKGRNGQFYSRRITSKHRLVYEIQEDIITVEVISSMGHYTDK